VRQVGYLLELYRDARSPEYKIKHESSLKIHSDTADASIKPNELPEILTRFGIVSKTDSNIVSFSNKSLLGSLGMKDSTQQYTSFKSYC
jgi:hypothetical protein